LIFVVVGLHGQGFERLVKMMDNVASTIDDEVIIQLGNTSYVPTYAKFFHFRDNTAIDELYRTACIVVTHGGVGSIMTALKNKKPVIVVPRLTEYHEHKNDHQLDIVNNLSKFGYVFVAHDSIELSKALNEIKNGSGILRSYPFGVEKAKMTQFVKQYLASIKHQK
jgi:beta-1,4-N-acetylglucosaminyltransferase